jgi:hypothetical protein
MNETCSSCGEVGDAAADGWSFAVEGKRRTYTCNECARANIRAIEGKLPEEWWE